ncbi:hypothetical protein, partial [Kaarinaea lacus]
MKLTFQLVVMVIAILVYSVAVAGPKKDLQRYQSYFKERFPDMSLVDLSNGMYMFSEDKRSQYNDIME